MNKLEKGQYLYDDLISRAWESEAFKNELIDNPKATIERVVGSNMPIPEGSNIVVEDQSNKNTFYINIPRKNANSDLELSEKQLESISGGDGGCTAAVIFGVIVGVIQICDWAGEGWNSYPPKKEKNEN